jgi:methylphosphotriester-DNA--protein-cysteine methyltransferase
MKWKRFAVAICIIVLIVGACLALAADYKYVGSVQSDKYHYPDCRYAQKIKPEHLVTFMSVKEALEAGCVPCKVCKPPTED